MRNFELLLKIECMKTANTAVHSCMDIRDTEENSAAAYDELGGRSRSDATPLVLPRSYSYMRSG